MKHCFGQAVGQDSDFRYTSGTLMVAQATAAGTAQELVTSWPCFQARLPENVKKKQNKTKHN